MLSLGLAVIFGLMGVINFAHGAFYMLGAIFTWMILTYLGLSYWPALLVCPLLVGFVALIVERFGLRYLYAVDPLYCFLFTLGFSLVAEGVLRNLYGSSGLPYNVPEQLTGAVNLGFMYMPKYRIWALLVSIFMCGGIFLLIERTRLGSILRAASENSTITQALGHNVPMLRSLIFVLGGALAGFAGVMAAPITQVSPLMGDDLIIVIFAIVVIGGMGSIGGSVIAGFLLGMIEALAKIWMPEASSVAIFVVMVVVLMIRPQGLFGKESAA
jgi:branched-chain amino acid transport system permease protein